jgi:hypothetical protein
MVLLAPRNSIVGLIFVQGIPCRGDPIGTFKEKLLESAGFAAFRIIDSSLFIDGLFPLY